MYVASPPQLAEACDARARVGCDERDGKGAPVEFAGTLTVAARRVRSTWTIVVSGRDVATRFDDAGALAIEPALVVLGRVAR